MWPDHAVELADQPDRGEGIPGAGDRLHDGPEAFRGRAVLRSDIHRGDGRGGCTGGRVQPRLWRRPRRGGCAVEPSRYRHGVLHRFDPRRHRGRQERGRDGEAGDPGAWRQEPEHRPRRRGLRQERGDRRGRDDAELGSELQRALAHAGAQVPQGRSDRRCAECRRAGDRRRPRRQLRHRAGGQQGAVRQGPGPDPEGHRRGRHGGRRRTG